MRLFWKVPAHSQSPDSELVQAGSGRLANPSTQCGPEKVEVPAPVTLPAQAHSPLNRRSSQPARTPRSSPSFDSEPAPGASDDLSSARSHRTRNSASLSRTTVIPTKPENAYITGPSSDRSNSGFVSSRLSLRQCCATPVKKEKHKRARKMGLSKSQRIMILLAIDTAFFFVELIVGYSVHSLALVADAFHMLNDVLSLCVGLWAVKVAQSGSTTMYTYGWQRAETLGALVNGVFLVALCVTIFLEAIQRFIEVPTVSNPKLVLIVGCLGLASNILGLVLFHDVGHSHSHGHDHSHGDTAVEAGEGHAHSHGVPQKNRHSHNHSSPHEHSHATEHSPLMGKKSSTSKREFSTIDEDESTVASALTLNRRSTLSGNDSAYRHRRRTSGFGSVDNIQIHPASLRYDIIQAARYQDEPPIDEDTLGTEETEESHDHDHDHVQHSHSHSPSPKKGYGATSIEIAQANAHHNHIHNQPREAKAGGHGHGHSHGDLNMRGVFLHVLGDALGNIGVIATALIIWLTTFPGRFYFDPAISLVITAIILTSAIPLCKAASRILLQAVPMGMSIDEIRADIEDLPQVVEAHHLHVWQLSDTKLVASLHVKVDCEVKGAGSASYMKLAREIRACLHGYGIHSSTIQPEFLQSAVPQDLLDDNEGSSSSEGPPPSQSNVAGGKSSKAGSLLSADGQLVGPGCMMDCEDTCGSGGQCCPSTDGKGVR